MRARHTVERVSRVAPELIALLLALPCLLPCCGVCGVVSRGVCLTHTYTVKPYAVVLHRYTGHGFLHVSVRARGGV